MDNNSVYEGEFLNELRHGKGKYYVNGKLIFDGEYSNGEKHGKCKEYDENGKLIFKGKYSEWKRIKKDNCLIL